MNMNERRTIGLFRQLIPRLIRRWEDKLFAADDEAARRRGWQVSRRPNGHGRRYRDPRWDLVSACLSCEGTGAAGARPCDACDGRGTVRLDRLHVTDGVLR